MPLSSRHLRSIRHYRPQSPFQQYFSWFGISGTALLWLKSYLSSRSKLLSYLSSLSKPLTTAHNPSHSPVGSLKALSWVRSSSFIHSGHFYSASSSLLLLRGAPDTARILCRSFTPKRTGNCIKDLPKVPTWRLEQESNPRPSGCK